MGITIGVGLDLQLSGFVINSIQYMSSPGKIK